MRQRKLICTMLASSLFLSSSPIYSANLVNFKKTKTYKKIKKTVSDTKTKIKKLDLSFLKDNAPIISAALGALAIIPTSIFLAYKYLYKRKKILNKNSELHDLLIGTRRPSSSTPTNVSFPIGSLKKINYKHSKPNRLLLPISTAAATGLIGFLYKWFFKSSTEGRAHNESLDNLSNFIAEKVNSETKKTLKKTIEAQIPKTMSNEFQKFTNLVSKKETQNLKITSKETNPERQTKIITKQPPIESPKIIAEKRKQEPNIDPITRTKKTRIRPQSSKKKRKRRLSKIINKRLLTPKPVSKVEIKQKNKKRRKKRTNSKSTITRFYVPQKKKKLKSLSLKRDNKTEKERREEKKKAWEKKIKEQQRKKQKEIEERMKKRDLIFNKNLKNQDKTRKKKEKNTFFKIKARSEYPFAELGKKVTRPSDYVSQVKRQWDKKNKKVK